MKTPQIAKTKHVRPSVAAFKCQQIDLFQDFLVNHNFQREPLSNTIELWDALPKYSISQVEQNKMRTKEGLLPLLRRDVTFMGNSYSIYISPALLSDENGRAYYPSANESLIEDALRKIATFQNQCFHDLKDMQCGVTFSLHQLRTELKNQGHTRSYQEVIKSLLILSGSDIEIRTKNAKGEGVSIEKFISLTGFSRKDRLENPDSQWVAYFHPLVEKAMRYVDYRQFNYSEMMHLKSHLARWLYKRLAHYYTNASLTTPITLSYAAIRQESGMLERARGNDAIKELEEIFKNFQAINVFSSVKRIEDKRGPRNKIINIVYEANPHQNFIKMVKAANKRQSDAKEKLLHVTTGKTITQSTNQPL
ncbi:MULTISPECIES: replication protein [unclassified Methylobacter]|uniref:replication protein n=1 Tax=unclassified Methylobacter TaxID=2635283 RepID=UPI001892FE8B|nr:MULTISPECIES: replication protein [unclassified Methylobacter]MBF6650030.1 replication protein [Methylobacter sp. BlB1]WAK04374.1 hypothetical protein LZ558_22160 [Methylobacter sp. YRD-M1]